MDVRKPKPSKLFIFGILAGGIASIGGLGFMISHAIEMVRSGRGLETYRTFWLVEFNWLRFLILLAVTGLALLVALVLRLREYLLWRSLEKKYGSERNDA